MSLWSSTVQSPGQLAYFDTDKDYTTVRIEAKEAHPAEIWHQDDATGPGQASGAQKHSRASSDSVVQHSSVPRAACIL